MVFKSDKQRKKVMAMLRGGTKSEVNPQIVGRVKGSGELVIARKDAKISDKKFFAKIERETGLPDFVFEEETELKKLRKLAPTHKFASTTFGGEDFDKNDARRFVKDEARLKKQGFKKIGITIEGPDDEEFEILAKRKK